MTAIPATLPSDPWVEFVPQTSNPGLVPADTLYQDDGTNFDAGTLVWGDLSNPSVFGSNFSIGDPGFEQGGINVGGVNFDATAKVNDFGGSLDAMLILHRHSTTAPATLVQSRSNSDTSAHGAVTPGQLLSQQFHMGWSGSHYDIAARQDVVVPAGSTVSPTSLAGEFRWYTTPDGSNVALLGMVLNSEQNLNMAGNDIINVVLVDGVDVGTEVPLNTIHRTSNGTDHGFIDQDVTTTASPTFAGLTINGNIIVTGTVDGVDLSSADPFPQYFLLAGRAGGQTAYGSPTNAENLTIGGNPGANPGFINMDSPVIFGPYAGNPSAAYAFSYTETESFPGSFVGGGLNFSGSLTFNASTFIYESFRGAPTITSNATPGFAAYTVLQSLPLMIAGNGAAEHPLQALVLNAGVQIRQPFSGIRTVPAVAAINFASTLNPSVNGATLTANGWIGMTVTPNWNTVAGSIVNFGNIIGIDCRAPQQALFGQSAGIERLNSYYGLQMANPTINNGFGTAPIAAVRSLITAGVNRFFLLNPGGANSSFQNGDALFNDAGGIVLGTANDVRLEWDNANSAFNFNPAVGEDLGFAFAVVSSKPTYLFEAQSFGASEINYTQIRFGFDRYAFGQTGVIGNQVGLFVAPNRTVDVAGGWSDYLLTQAGSLNIGTFAMSDVAAWTINQISLDNTAGSISSLDNLVIGGMTTSNPGITVTERSALRVTGRSKLRGSVQYVPINPSALSAGDNDDWAGLLTGSPNNNGRYWARVTGNATTSFITGIDSTAVQDGDTFEITNVGSEIILIPSEDTASIAANRIVVVSGDNFVLKPDGTVTVRYDSTSSRWRVTTQQGAVAPLTGFWRFDSNTTMADPGTGAFRTNNATVGSVTQIAINDISFRGGDVSNILSNIAAGDQLYIQNLGSGDEFLTFNITSTTDNTTWWQVDGTISSSGNNFTNNNEFGIAFIFA